MTLCVYGVVALICNVVAVESSSITCSAQSLAHIAHAQVMLAIVWYIKVFGGQPSPLPVDGHFSKFSMLVMSFEARELPLQVRACACALLRSEHFSSEFLMLVMSFEARELLLQVRVCSVMDERLLMRGLKSDRGHET